MPAPSLSFPSLGKRRAGFFDCRLSLGLFPNFFVPPVALSLAGCLAAQPLSPSGKALKPGPKYWVEPLTLEGFRPSAKGVKAIPLFAERLKYLFGVFPRKYKEN